MQITTETPGLHEFEVHKWSVEASDLGLKPGEFPQAIETTLGNGMPFYAYHTNAVEGDIIYVAYMQGNGCIQLRIYND